jgi:pyruvate-formate lyase
MSDESSTPVEAMAPVEAPIDTLLEKAEVTPAIQPNKKKFKIKVDGNEEEMELDLNDEQTLIRHLQMSKAASKRMNEAAMTRKQAEQFITALQNDPMKVLTDPRIMGNEKFQAIAEEFLSKKLQEQMLSPEERRRIEMEDRLRKYEDQEKSAKEKEEQAQIAQLEEHYAQEYQKTIMTALQSTNLPKNPFTVKRMAELMQKNIKHGLDLDPHHLAQLVKEDYQKELVGLIGGSDASQIISMFGEDLTNKIRKHDLAKYKENFLMK